MLLEPSGAQVGGDDIVTRDAPAIARTRWGVDSEFGRLTDVMVSPPPHLEIVPCNSVSIQAIADGLSCSAADAERQHAALIRALRDEGVRCAVVPADAAMPDLSFTRDATFMTPWGLLALRPAAAHRRGEVAHIRRHAFGWGVPFAGEIAGGTIEGGDICLLAPGTVAVGWSGERTSKEGALATAAFFEARGWRALVTRFDPHYLHLDTLFAMVGRDRAVACVEALDPAFVGAVRARGIDIVPVGVAEVGRLATNLLALGDGRILSAAANLRVNVALAALGYRVIAVDIDQFTRCGGGVHCLTMPLARAPG